MRNPTGKTYTTVNKYYWADPTDPVYTLDLQLSRKYRDNRENGHEEAGLFLDLDAGTLSYSRSGMYVMDIAMDLQGVYVWAVCMVHKHVTDRHTPVSFSCKRF